MPQRHSIFSQNFIKKRTKKVQWLDFFFFSQLQMKFTPKRMKIKYSWLRVVGKFYEWKEGEKLIERKKREKRWTWDGGIKKREMREIESGRREREEDKRERLDRKEKKKMKERKREINREKWERLTERRERGRERLTERRERESGK